MLFRPTTTMSIPQFCKLQRGELTLKQIREENEIEGFATHIRNNKNLEKMFVFVTGSLIYFSKIVSAAENSPKGIDTLGFKLLGVFRQFAYWVCIIGCIIEICKSLMQGDHKSIGKIIAKYVLAFAAIYFVPWIFDIIKGEF